MMICENCGKEMPDGAKFCPECGTVVPAGEVRDGLMQAAEIIEHKKTADRPANRKNRSSYLNGSEISGEKVTDNIYRCPDGKYRWYYEFHMLKNPVILFTVWNVLGISAGVVFLVNFFASLGGYIRDGWSGFLNFTGKFLLFAVGFMVIIGGISYLILAWIYGWKYMVLFEMDEDSLTHIQMGKQVQKAQAIGWLTTLAGLAGNNLTTVGIGLTTAAKTTSCSNLRSVKEVKTLRRLHTIKLNQLLDHNQIYTEDADFDFVLNFLKEHCPYAKIR